ncbi:basic leucine zipper transcriptional factor ATF-like 2 [Discoglossus pictus]
MTNGKKNIGGEKRNLSQSDDGETENISKIKKRERNREAALKSRKKHTQKADALHQEFERLEKDNSALKKEIQSLLLQKKHLTQALEEHEPTCFLFSPEIISEFLKTVDTSLLQENHTAGIN